MAASVSKEIQQALAALREGRAQQAEEICRQALERRPDDAETLHVSGIVAARRGEPARAAELIRQAIAHRADVPEYHANLADALRSLEKYDESIAACREAIRLRPHYPIAYNNLSVALRMSGNAQGARAAAETALRQNPKYLKAHVNLAVALHKLRRFDESIKQWRRVLSIQPGQVRAHLDLGLALYENGDEKAAIAEWQETIRLKPDFLEARLNIGLALHRASQFDRAISVFREGLRLNPDHPPLTQSLANSLFFQGKLDEALQCLVQLLEKNPELATLQHLLFILHYDSRQRPQEIFEAHLRYEREFVAPLKLPIEPPTNSRDPERRLKIGYLSGDFGQNAPAYFIEPVIRAHHRSEVEVFCYSTREVSDFKTDRFRAIADQWRDIAAVSDEDVAAMVRRDGIDILLDLAGLTKGERSLLFARRPAPVQAAWLGYPGTTGLSSIDYRITDAIADPPGQTEQWYTERLLRLPRCAWCYQPPPTVTPNARAPFVENGFVTFGSLNRLSKISDDLIAIWSRILAATPGSKLLMKTFALTCDATREFVRQRFVARDVDPQRLLLLPAQDEFENHLRVYDSIDIALDCYPYNGTTTTCEALAMGVPVITLAGEAHVSRVSKSLLTHAGFPQLVADSPLGYFEIATTLASDQQKLLSLRERIRTEFRTSPVCDADAFARDLENAYRTIWREFCSRA